MNYARWRAAALFLTISALAAAPAFAMPGSKTVRTTDPAERFAAMDSSKDGKVSWEEFQTARPNLNENAFKMIDKDSDGGISLELGHLKQGGEPLGMPADEVPHQAVA